MKTKIITLLLITLLCGIGYSVFIPATVHAQEKVENLDLSIPKSKLLPGNQNAQETDKGGSYLATDLLPKLTKIIIGMASISSFVFMVIGGVRFMGAFGQQEQITAAKKQIIWALVGLVISMFAYVIVSIITSVNFK